MRMIVLVLRSNQRNRLPLRGGVALLSAGHRLHFCSVTVMRAVILILEDLLAEPQHTIRDTNMLTHTR